MPRSLSVPARLYQPGEYGPFQLNGFTNANTDRLVLRVSWEDWPETPQLFSVVAAWDDGTEARFDVSGGRPRKRGGGFADEWVGVIGVRRTGNGKGKVSKADVSLTVHEPFRAAINLAAE